MTTKNTVAIAYIEYPDQPGQGKKRPVLLFGKMSDGSSPRAFKITSQYEKKSEKIRAKYYRIRDWQGCGLRKQSYVDCNNMINTNDIPNLTKIGALQYVDVRGLDSFLQNLQ